MSEKDKILKTMVSNPNRNPDSFFTPDSLQEHIFPDLNYDQVEYLIKEILRLKPELINIVKIIGVPFAIEPTGLVEPFIQNGGFTKIDKDLEEERIKRIEREAKNDKLLELDLKLRSFESRIGKKLIIAGFIITFLSFLIAIITLEYW